jgi:hypothetical protein
MMNSSNERTPTTTHARQKPRQNGIEINWDHALEKPVKIRQRFASARKLYFVNSEPGRLQEKINPPSFYEENGTGFGL